MLQETLTPDVLLLGEPQTCLLAGTNDLSMIDISLQDLVVPVNPRIEIDSFGGLLIKLTALSVAAVPVPTAECDHENQANRSLLTR